MAELQVEKIIDKDYTGKKLPVEYLTFQIEDPELVDRFIQLDHEIWTEYLSSFSGFISKEIWVNYDNPGEVHSVIIWETMDKWKSIPLEKNKEVDKEFMEKFGQPFKMVRRIHKEYNHGLHKVRHFELKKDL